LRQISLSKVIPGMILARSLLSSKGQILLVSGVTLTEEYIRKLQLLDLDTIFIKDEKYADINVPEYLAMETQQRALSILTATIQKIHKEGTFSIDPVSCIASDIVEELMDQKEVLIHLTGIATHDDCTLSHSLNCAIYSALLARAWGFTVSQIKVITCGALLHDIGKVGIDTQLLNKLDALTTEEIEIIKQHPALGFKMLTKKRLEISSLVAHMAWQHHERIDGSGYPRGLKGEEIFSYARLLSITDVYDAITAHRPYQEALMPEVAYNVICDGLGSSFDQEFGELFLSKIALFPPGTEVLLNTGELAIVVSVSGSAPKRPMLRLISDPEGIPYTPPKDISLIANPELSILRTK